MKFYNRVRELDQLNRLEALSSKQGVMTVLTGRRRIGKTALALHHAKSLPKERRFLYLFIGRKDEFLLCQEFVEEIKKTIDYPIFGEITRIQDVFLLLIELSKREKITVVVDEFQEFYHINKSVYSDLQKIWDIHKDAAHIHLIFIGSVYSLMHKIFEDEKEPLFGRADRIMKINPFAPSTLAEILRDFDQLTPQTYFNYYALTGGMPKYIDLFLREGAFQQEEMLSVIFQKDSPFLSEGKNLLIEEFGRDYATYFSILELIARGKTSRSEMESSLEKDIGGYLQRLEDNYGIISRHRPLHLKEKTRQQKYKMIDPFLNFWFRFIYRHRTALEMENFDYLRSILYRDYATYCGPILERLYQAIFAESGRYSQIGSYWEKDNTHEIDVVAVNELEKTILFAETKLNPNKIILNLLEKKSEKLLTHYPGYQARYLSLSVENLLDF